MKDCVSLEVALKLQKAGYKVKCYWFLARTLPSDIIRYGLISKEQIPKVKELMGENYIFEDMLPAPTATQLAEELPHTALGAFLHVMKQGDGTWNIAYGLEKTIFDCKTFPDALGLMMVYLLENKLI